MLGAQAQRGLVPRGLSLWKKKEIKLAEAAKNTKKICGKAREVEEDEIKELLSLSQSVKSSGERSQNSLWRLISAS